MRAGNAPARDDAPGADDPLGREVRRLFAALAHAGEPATAPAAATLRLASGEAGREQHGARVRFTLQLDGRRLVAVRYRAYGCPYTLAACEWLAQRLESGPPEPIGGPTDWAQKLQIPAAKLGRLLVVEDALRAAWATADKTMTDS
jgi:nitrogen fixation NifU-like protein